MQLAIRGFLVFLLTLSTCLAKVVVFWQPGFPAIDTDVPSESVLKAALESQDAAWVPAGQLAAQLPGTALLVMPYGSAFPIESWSAIHTFLRTGGHVLVIGGEPFRVPVLGASPQTPTSAYAEELGIRHSYALGPAPSADFEWKDSTIEVQPVARIEAKQLYVVEGGGINGCGYLMALDGNRFASPVVTSRGNVFLDFEAAPGYWNSAAGAALLKSAVALATQPRVLFQVEMQYSSYRPGETPEANVHLRGDVHGDATLVVADDRGNQIATKSLSGLSDYADVSVDFPGDLKPGFYRVTATLSADGKQLGRYENGFWIDDGSSLRSGPALGSNADFLTLGGKPFFPFGTNYFSTESNGWDFSRRRNAAVWQQDFSEMQKNGVNFVRTGVWGGQASFIAQPEGGVSERFLRNVEAYLLSARAHNIAVNFTFFAFDPQTIMRSRQGPGTLFPGTNPYLDPVTVNAEKEYLRSILQRFKDVPALCWDLINEPSFSSPEHLWHGNTPNGDPAEQHAWHEWLKKRYGTAAEVARAWSVAADTFANIDSIPPPDAQALTNDMETGTKDRVRAYDYNLFAQDSFSDWVADMVKTIRDAGSKQLIDVGQDEGGVENRVLNQFYAHSGVSFTTNHTYRANQDLIWDSIAAKAPGVPNIVGETGYQPVNYPNGDWHFDEQTGFGLIERKWAAGFAAGTSGALSWDWDREIYFGLLRSDGSMKSWFNILRGMGDFVKAAEPYATGLQLPDVAIVIPQSLQLSVFNPLAIRAQQTAIHALFGYARSEAYAVGEDQLDRLGNPKLILVPSPWTLADTAWKQLEAAANKGATVLITGAFDQDPHFLSTDRAAQLNVGYAHALLQSMTDHINWPGGNAELSFRDEQTNYLPFASFPGGKTFAEKQMGSGRFLLASFPVELNSNWQAVGDIYRYALKVAGVQPWYSTDVNDEAVMIAPTRFPHATLYVVTSDAEAQRVSFRDERSGRSFSSDLGAGRAALLLVRDDGTLAASYNWK